MELRILAVIILRRDDFDTEFPIFTVNKVRCITGSSRELKRRPMLLVVPFNQLLTNATFVSFLL